MFRIPGFFAFEGRFGPASDWLSCYDLFRGVKPEL